MRLFYSVLILLAVPMVTNAALLGATTSEVFDCGTGGLIPHEASVKFHYKNEAPALFDDVVLTPSSIGLTVTANSGSDPDFDGIAAKMVNGVGEFLQVTVVQMGCFKSANETIWFALGSDDFAGNIVDTITMTVDEIAFREQDGATWVYLAVTFRVYGEGVLPVSATTWGGIKAMYR